MIGEHDEFVGSRRMGGPLDQVCQRRVAAIQGLECLDALRSRVMGNLVMVGEVGIDDVAPRYIS